MQTITNALYTISLPEGFTLEKRERLFLEAKDNRVPCDIQFPTISVVVYKRTDLETDTFKGNTLQEKFEDACLSLAFKSEKLSSEKTMFQGLETFVLHAHTDAPWMDVHFKIRYFYAGMLLDDDYMLEFRAMHEKLPSDELASWVMPAFESVQILGDTALRNQTWKLHEADMDADTQVFEQSLIAQEEARKNADEKEKQDKKERFSTVEIPVDGKEIFRIADFNFEFVPEASKISITEVTREVQVVLKAKTSDIKKAVAATLLNDYPNDGVVTLTIPAKEVHDNGIPTGQLYFEDGGTDAPFFLYVETNGFDYGLHFTGSVTFDAGWVMLKGELTKSYDALTFPVQISKKFDVSKLKWQNYRFTSMQQTQTAHPNDVRFLILTNPDFTQLPEAIFSFKNLQELSIVQKSNNWESEKLPLNHIQEEIGQLPNLKRLHINGTGLETLPQSIAQLQHLEQLAVNNSLLKTVPAGIWQLPQLKYLWFSTNRLSHIPEDIRLPKLESIALNKNQLKTLPESLATQPKLRKIDIQQNPLEFLPDAFNRVEALELAMEDKLRLLDFGYKGADGIGLVPWNDAMFWSKNDADLLPEIQSVIRENKLQEYVAALESTVKKAVGFKNTVEEDYRRVGNCRFGGMPDLPESVPYPRFGKNWRDDKEDYIYEFLGQINCGEIAHLQDYLPRKGMLFFFLQTIHSIYGSNHNAGKVIYCEDISTLSSGKRFQFTTDDYSEMYDAAYYASKVEAFKMNSVPSFYAAYVNKHLFLGEAEKLKDNERFLQDLYDTFERPMEENNSRHYAVNNHGFTQHEAPELQASLEKKGNPQDWMTLLSLNSVEDMQWGDAGEQFFVIHKSDLAKCDFSNVFVTMESS